jgi:hypothetical protein
MGQTVSAPRRPALGDSARLAAALAKAAKLGPTYSKVLFLIGGFIDAGHPDPSWSELAERTSLERTTIRNAINACDRRGVLLVTAGQPGERDSYELRETRLKGAQPR